tara:strand:+ start:578 stop:955 length:378 start_codon:yes stop_codon:yes gene_type:complete
MKRSELRKEIKKIIAEQTAIDLKNQDISANVDKEFYDKFTQFSQLYSEIWGIIAARDPISPFSTYYESNEEQINRVGGLITGIQDDLDDAFSDMSDREKEDKALGIGDYGPGGPKDNFPKIEDYF